MIGNFINKQLSGDWSVKLKYPSNNAENKNKIKKLG